MKFVNNFLQETNKNLMRYFEISGIHFLRKEQKSYGNNILQMQYIL